MEFFKNSNLLKSLRKFTKDHNQVKGKVFIYTFDLLKLKLNFKSKSCILILSQPLREEGESEIVIKSTLFMVPELDFKIFQLFK